MNPASLQIRRVVARSLFLLGACLSSCAMHPPAEAEWNSLHIWQRLPGDPPAYVPTGYKASLPRTEREGTWFSDKRDGKRLFVPSLKVGPWEPATLIGEAKKVTGFRQPSTKSLAKKAFAIPVWFLARVGARVPVPD